jgi:exopolyphosphatase/pppGpp-phosphohydrolase
MATIRWKREEFTIVGQLLHRTTFNEWIKKEGSLVLHQQLKRTRARWFFGKSRARRALHKTAKKALRRDGWFARMLKRRLDELPKVIRKVSVAIKRNGHKDLLSIASDRGLVVVPRAVALNEFVGFLNDELARADVLAKFEGLASRVLEDVARETESLFFKHFEKGNRQLVDSSGKGAIIGVDKEFNWRLNKINGHYFYAYTQDDEGDLSSKRNVRRFKSDMKEVLQGQQVYLRRLQSMEVVAISDAFRS